MEDNNKSDVTIKVKVDTSEVDSALNKIEKLKESIIETEKCFYRLKLSTNPKKSFRNIKRFLGR